MAGQTSLGIGGDLKMPAIPVELPDELRRFVEWRVQHGQFASASDYIVALVDAARSKRSEIEAALIEGLQSGPPEEWTSQEWADIKQRVVRRRQEG
jgi:antitoxin ParD1/3/4